MFDTIVFMDCVRCGDSLISVYYCDPFYGGCGNIDQECLSGGICCECGQSVVRCQYCYKKDGGCGYICKPKSRVSRW